MSKSELTFKQFSKTNRQRCNIDIHKIEEWSITDWGCALSGEVGELCNLLKKVRRGSKKLDKKTMKEIRYEIADVMGYLDLLAARLNIELEPAIVEKFNLVSKKYKSKIKL